MTEQNTTRGIWLMVATALIFALQDGFSRHLAGEYNVLMIIMIRYWFFGAFVIAVYPLLIAALSGPLLGERVGWRRWVAIGIGFLGVLIILQPGYAVFQPAALVPLLAAFMFALYGLLTRYVGREDSAAVSFFWTGTVGAVTMTAIGIWFWEPMAPSDWVWMGALCVSSAFSHFLLIRAYELAEASAVQPFAYLQLPFAAGLGLLIFDETLRWNVALGALVVVGAGLFTLWRARRVAQG